MIDPPPGPARTQMTKFLAKHPASAWATQHLAELEPTTCAELGTVRAAVLDLGHAVGFKVSRLMFEAKFKKSL